MIGKKQRLPALGLAAAGLCASLVLVAVHVRSHTEPDYESVCSVAQGFDCSAVALSRFSVLLGVPVPAIGAAGFVALGLAFYRGYRIALPLAALASVASVVLLAVELLVIRSVCLLCEVVHLCSWAMLWLAWVSRAALAPAPRTGLMAVLAAPTALVALSAFAASSYTAPTSWTSMGDVPRGVGGDGLHWAGAKSPALTVTEYVDYSCPHCGVAARKTRRVFADKFDRLRLVRFPLSRMRCVRLAEGANRSCEFVRAALCAGDVGKFWEMDGWLLSHAPGTAVLDVERASREVGIDPSVLTECMRSPDTFRRADALAAAAMRRHMVEAPAYTVGDRKLSAREAHERLDAL
ncbi:MAG: thioredoxin domain-containing protein [Deltaproteobacteria bacterium]|nr:thioredoxin domain-containing protein [Deltaproteobacteria bacterium]